MSTSSSGPAQDVSGEPAATGLRGDYLSLPNVIGQSLGTAAAAGSITLSVGVVFASAGNGTWLVYVFSAVTLLLVAASIDRFARHGSSSGGLFVFVAKGLGATLSVVAGWSLLIAYLFAAAAMITGAASYLLVLVHDWAGIAGGRDLAVGFSMITVTVAWALAYRDIRLSSRLSLWIVAIAVGLIVLVVVGSIVTKGPVLDGAQGRLTDVTIDHLRLGLLFAFFGFVGFESATVLGNEARRPLAAIPRAVVLAISATGMLVVVSAYGLVGAFHGAEPGLDKVSAPLELLARNIHLGAARAIISAAVVLSLFAGALGNLNAGARVLFVLSRHGLFHRAAAHIHAINATPDVALTVLAVTALGLSLGLTIFGVALIAGSPSIGSIATFGFLVAYLLVAVAAPIYLRRIGVLTRRDTAMAAAAVLLLAIPLIGSLYPVPVWPVSLLPYAFLLLLGCGLARFWWVRLRSPQDVLAMQRHFHGQR